MWSEPIRIDDLTKRGLQYPLIATPKGNGERHWTDNRGIPRNIMGNPIVNDYVREQIEEYGMDGVDGHIQVAGGTSPADAVFALAEKDGKLDFEFFVQDVSGTNKVYSDRSNLECVLPAPRPDWMVLAKPVTVHDDEGAERYWKAMSTLGHAGICLRKGSLPYYEGNMSISLLAHIEYSKYVTGVAIAMGFTTNGSTLDYITCKDIETGRTFNVASGFTPKQRLDIWRDHAVYTKFTVRYEHQPLGTDVPLNARFIKISKR